MSLLSWCSSILPARPLLFGREALRRSPEIRKLGTFGDPAFEEALEAAVDLIDGEDGSTSSATVELQMDLEKLETDADASGDTSEEL
jgi:hypothetical protein